MQAFVESRTHSDYLRDRMLRGAVERHVEIIGEAAKGVSRAYKDAHPEIPWERIVGQRHVLAHAYGEIDSGLMWRVATQRIPELIDLLRPFVASGGH